MSQNSKIGAGLGGVVLTAGAIAFGAFLSNRHQNRGYDDAANHTKRQPEGDNAQVGRSVTIRKPRAELFAFWSDFSNLPQFMENVEAIEAGADGASTWRIKAPAGQTVAVKTEIASKKQNELIAWRSVEDSEIETSGEVRFDPPAGALGRAVAKLFLREPQVQARHDLKRFKMLMETGEIATSARTRDETRAAKQENG